MTEDGKGKTIPPEARFAKIEGQERVGYWAQFGGYTGVIRTFYKDAQKDAVSINVEIRRLLTENVQEDREWVAKRITEWMKTDKPANQAFTEGPLRQIGYAVEEKAKSVQEACAKVAEEAIGATRREIAQAIRAMEVK